MQAVAGHAAGIPRPDDIIPLVARYIQEPRRTTYEART